jgi:hypothetical protein
MIRLDAVDDGRLVDRGVDLPRRLRPGGSVRAELAPTDLQDRVRVETVEGAQADELVVALPTERPVVGSVRQRRLEPAPVVADRPAGSDDGPLQALAFCRRQRPASSRDDLEERGQVTGRLDLEVLPQPHLGTTRAGAVLVEPGRSRLEP